MATSAPEEVPMAVATKAVMMKMPGRMKWVGTRESPRFTTLSTPPISLHTPENAPATRKIMHMSMVPSSPAAWQKCLTFSGRDI